MDQILYGWLLGLWLAFATHYLLRDLILEHTGNMLNQTIVYTKTQTSIFFWVASTIFGFAILLTMGVYFIVSATFTIP